jgi:hypothetical protein
VEARLTETLPQPGIRREACALDVRIETDQPHSAAMIRIDRYLAAAGVDDQERRRRLAVATARDLLARGGAKPFDPEPSWGETSWAEIIAAVDRQLTAEFAPESSDEAPDPRGRVALAAARFGKGGGIDANWGTPPRRHRAMAAQDLSLWRPSPGAVAAQFAQLRVGRAAQGLAAGLCWLAVVVVP